MPQGELKKRNNSKNTQKNNKKKKQNAKRTNGKTVSAKKPYLVEKDRIQKKITKIINKNIEEQIIERTNRDKPGVLNIIKETRLSATDNIKRRKKLQKEIGKVLS